MDLKTLNDKLPAGIRAVVVRGVIHYVVRSSYKGVKTSIGTFLSLDVAIQKLAEYKIKKMTSLLPADLDSVADQVTAYEAEQQASKPIANMPTSMPADEAAELLQTAIDEQGPHILLGGNKPIKITLDDKTHIISAEIVAEAYQKIWNAPATMPDTGESAEIQADTDKETSNAAKFFSGE